MKTREILVAGGFDDLRPRQVRFLQEASRLGKVRVHLWSDDIIRLIENRAPRFPEAERLYLIEAIRYVSGTSLVRKYNGEDPLPLADGFHPDVWVVDEAAARPQQHEYCRSRGLEYRVLKEAELQGFPVPEPDARPASSSRPRVIVTGCYDWFHSGHVRFFEEVSKLGDLFAVVGHDANIRRLKGEGHPMLPQQIRRYMVQSVRHVKQALISTGDGWMDAAPQIAEIEPQIYVVNEDGDRPDKREFCRTHGLQYVVLKRIPKEGLPPRQSTDLRGY